VPLVDDQRAVEEFAAEGADEALGDGGGPRNSYRRLMIWMSVADWNLKCTTGVDRSVVSSSSCTITNVRKGDRVCGLCHGYRRLHEVRRI